MGPQPSPAGVDDPHASIVADLEGLDEVKQLVHCIGGHQPDGLPQTEESREREPRRCRPGRAPACWLPIGSSILQQGTGRSKPCCHGGDWWRTSFGAELSLIPISCQEILGVTTLSSWWDQPRVENSVAPKKRLPGHMLSALYSPEALSAHRAVMLSETPDCKAVLLARGFLWGRLLFCPGGGKNGSKSIRTSKFCDPALSLC